jgi:hypothetical protein
MAFLAVAMVAFAEPVIELVASAKFVSGYVAVLPIAMGLVIQIVSMIMGIGIDLSNELLAALGLTNRSAALCVGAMRHRCAYNPSPSLRD